jgi:exodeoxyribonuclease V beta subunit
MNSRIPTRCRTPSFGALRHRASWLYLIGDPKQAIYGFRGADVFAYLRASAGAQRFHLGTNYRSTEPLVHAVNSLFERRPAPFVASEITFTPVAAAGRAERAGDHT